MHDKYACLFWVCVTVRVACECVCARACGVYLKADYGGQQDRATPCRCLGHPTVPSSPPPLTSVLMLVKVY